MASKRPGFKQYHSGNYPTLTRMALGDNPDPTQDALGRFAIRNNEEPSQTVRQNPRGGMPQARGPQDFIPYLIEAARRRGLPPQLATDGTTMQKVQQLGNVPQQMARRLKTANPRRQADMILGGLQ